MSTRPLFVTQVYEASFAAEKGFAAFNAELEEACRMLADEDLAGQRWCRDNAYGGYTSYASLDDLPQRASVFGELKTRLDKHAKAFAADLQMDLGGGRLKLEDPRLPLMMAAPPRRTDADETSRTFVYLQPEPGSLILWESWLRHEVPPNAAKRERISISFNYGWR